MCHTSFYQYSSYIYGRLENDITIENATSRNTIDAFSFNGIEYPFLLYSPTNEYPNECSIGIFQSNNSITTPSVAVPDTACTQAMLTGSAEDPDKITYDFYIYTADLAEYTRASLWLPAKSGSSYDNGRISSRE